MYNFENLYARLPVEMIPKHSEGLQWLELSFVDS